MFNPLQRSSVYGSQKSISSYCSYTDSSFSFDEGPIGPLFPFSLVSSFQPTLRKNYRKNIILDGSNRLRLRTAGGGKEEGNEGINIIASRVKSLKPKYAQHLAVEADTQDSMTSKEFKTTISALIKSSKSLRYLNLDLQKSQNSWFGKKAKLATDRDLIWFGTHLLKYMTNLKHFSIQFSKDSSFTEEGLKVFCRLVCKHLKKLECFILDFNRCKIIGDDYLKSLTHLSSNYLCHLKDFRVLTPNAATEEMKKNHFNKSRYLKNLQSLELYLGGHNNLWSRSTKEINFGQKRSVQNHLSLYFAVIKPEDHNNALQILYSSMLKSIQALQVLDLDFEGLNVTKDTAQIFINALNDAVHSLEHFKLHLGVCGLFTQEFLNLFKFPENNHLSKLEIQFEGQKFRPDSVQIQDQEVKALTSMIAQRLTKLESLNISFFWLSEITEETLTAFKEDFCAENALSNLKSLIITFSSCDNLTEKGINSLRTVLKES